MNPQTFIFSKKGWRSIILILPTLFCFCQNGQSTADSKEYGCTPDYFNFTIDEVTFKSLPNDSLPIRWEYLNDERYDYDNFDMDCECQEYVLDEDDVHYFSFPIHPKKELQISIRKYWVNWSGHEFSTGGYDFDNKKLFESPKIVMQLTDKETGCQYEKRKGRLYIRRFKFEKCIEADFKAELESPDCDVIVVSGSFSASYTGLIKTE